MRSEFLLAVLVYASVVVSFEDFCNPKLCPSDVTHVACNNNTGFQSTCPAGANPLQVPLTAELQQLILDEHNNYRNQIAIGNITGYKPAAKIPQIAWDADLAYVSGFNARGCIMKHDVCRATSNYPYSGQNLAGTSSTGRFIDDRVALKQMIGNWFNEYPNANMDIINKYHTVSGPVYGHFTALIQQKSAHVGCSLVRYQNGKWFVSYLACNYEYTNMIGDSVYTAGQTRSLCNGKFSDSFNGLCAKV